MTAGALDEPVDSGRLGAAVDRVIAADACSGCGLCASLGGGFAMRLDPAGFARPTRVGDAAPGYDDARATAEFDASCPGVRVEAPRPAGAARHPTMGPVVAAWQAWATDPGIRHRGSSGGAITALTAWLLESGEAVSTVAARVDAEAPRRTVSVSIQTREEALAAAGSRYAPASNASLPVPPGSAVVGKPCEISALRAVAHARSEPAPLLVSFFCAGTPSQHATDALVADLGVPDGARLDDLWYRGRGWPGEFTAVPAEGIPVSTSYDESWGARLGPSVQWRCKICPDGVGESADITAADFWQADARGYPVFAEADGVSALLARTTRGRDVVERALAAGVIAATPIDVDDLARIQPLQVRRRTTLLGRLAGTVAAGRRVPRYRGFGLGMLALGHPREAVRTARGTFRRVRARIARTDAGSS